MTEQSYDKRHIALTQIETALRLFREGNDYFSVITLAGSAEEILGNLLILNNKKNSLNDHIAGVILVHKHFTGEDIDEKVIVERTNRARNALKHLMAGGFPIVSLDIRDEAKNMLYRAIDNYWLLEESQTPEMESFIRKQREV
jgi:hypothetical protein